MDEFRRLTYKTPDGAWGIEGVSLLTCPARLYGAAAKLCDMESLCEDVYSAKDAELTLDALPKKRGRAKRTEIKLPLAVGQATPRFVWKASSEKADIFARLNRYWSEKGPGSMIKLSEACGLDASKLYLMQRNDGKFDIEHWRAVNAGLDKLGYGGMK